MFGMSMTEIVVILVLALLVLGPKELPKAARAIGKTLREVRRAGDDLKSTFEREVMREPGEPKYPVRAPEGAVSAKGSRGDDEAPTLAQANAAPSAEATTEKAPVDTSTGGA